jgi:hypothetical protein
MLALEIVTMIAIQRRCFWNIATAVLFVGVPTLCSAQDKGPTWMRFQTNRIKPEMRAEYEGYVKQVSAGYKKVGVPFFVIYQNYAGDINEYTGVLPIMKFAEMDGPNPLTKVMGEEGLANLLRSMNNCVVSQTRYFAIPQDDLMINKGQFGALWVQTRTVVANGKMDDYMNWMKNDYKPALEKAGVTQFRAARPIFGAPSNNMVESIRLLKDFAEIDGGPILNQKLGADAVRALNAKVSGIVQGTRITIIRMRPDLSYMGAVTGTN